MTIALPNALSGLRTAYTGGRGAVFWLSLKVGLLTVLTLGIYRFWGKTRLRRWYWSSLRPGGHGLEYTGQGSEKLAGFLLAVTILAFWLGVVNLLIMFGVLTLLPYPQLTYPISFALLIPLWFFARYRARSYVLARTRWRGIRFGMAPGARGYAMRALWHWAVTILSAGLLWPRMTFALEKYRTDRTFFGDRRLHQGGDWRMLWPGFAPLWLAGVLTGLVFAIGQTSHPNFLWLLPVTLVAAGLGLIHYRATSKRLLTEHKSAGDLTLALPLQTAPVARITVFGGLTLLILMLIPLMVLGAATYYLQISGVFGTSQFATLSFAQWAAVVLAGLAYFGVFLLWGAMRHAFVTMPLWRYYARVLQVRPGDAISGVKQRSRDHAAQAEGLAEALDLGAAI